MSDCIAKRKAALVETYRSHRLHLDGIVSLAFQLELGSDDVRDLLEQLAETEQGETPRERQQAMLVRAYRRLSLPELLGLAVDLLDFDADETTELVDSCGAIALLRQAA